MAIHGILMDCNNKCPFKSDSFVHISQILNKEKCAIPFNCHIKTTSGIRCINSKIDFSHKRKYSLNRIHHWILSDE